MDKRWFPDPPVVEKPKPASPPEPRPQYNIHHLEDRACACGVEAEGVWRCLKIPGHSPPWPRFEGITLLRVCHTAITMQDCPVWSREARHDALFPAPLDDNSTPTILKKSAGKAKWRNISKPGIYPRALNNDTTFFCQRPNCNRRVKKGEMCCVVAIERHNRLDGERYCSVECMLDVQAVIGAGREEWLEEMRAATLRNMVDAMRSGTFDEEFLGVLPEVEAADREPTTWTVQAGDPIFAARKEEETFRTGRKSRK